MQVTGIAESVRATVREATVRPSSARSSFRDALREAQADDATYTVQKGDNLSRICRDYLARTGGDTSPRDVWRAVRHVAEMNDLRDPDFILPGQELDLSVLTPAAPADPEEHWAETETESAPEMPAAAAAAVPDMASVAHFQTLAALVQSSLPSIAGDFGEEPEFMPLTALSLQESLAGAMGGIGPVGNPSPREEPAFLSAEAELERALRLIDSVVKTEQGRLSKFEIESPWSQLLSEPAHLTSEFGIRRDPFTRRWEHHAGVDLAAPRGTEIRAFRAGEVVYSGWQAGYGRVVVVRHDDGLETVYGHNAQNLVKTGDRVEAQTVLAKVGSTGRSTGPHLHFEVRRNGTAIDPIPFLAPGPNEALAKAY